LSFGFIPSCPKISIVEKVPRAAEKNVYCTAVG
jgi:hypothetical protein